MPRNFPESTYRLQFHKGFTFRDASAITPYLAEVGITHVYASPYLKAKPGSTHGYDVIDHCSLNPELGTPEDYEAWLATLKDHGLSHILDIVPNHVGVATNENKWWNDVLKHGPTSPYAKYFDIAWQGSPRPELHNKVLLPLLGEPYADVLEDGQLKLSRQGDDYYAHYHDRRFPIAPETYHLIPKSNPDAITADQLDTLLNHQHYRLAWWRTASDEINYRRFFDINDLAALSVEREEVFQTTHRFILDLVAQGKVTGLRIDHPDGLYDPKQYFERLQSAIRDLKSEIPIYAEKILAAHEPLRFHGLIHGTTGYDFLNMTNGLFIDAVNEQAFTQIYRDWTGDRTPFPDIAYQKKRLVLETALASELHMLAHELDRLAQRDRRSRDFTLNSLRQALREVIACFGVYRTYITDEGLVDADISEIESAIEEAIRVNPDIDPSVFYFIHHTLLFEFEREDLLAEQVRFAGKFQQLTAPATAKGVEDTAFYCYHRLISLNEVGGDPAHFGVSPDQLHAYYQDRQQHWPHALSALSTHDTKRSEDVRARINVLSEIPNEWRTHATRWRDLNAPHGTDIAPDEEYLLYQTLIGAWPLDPAEATNTNFSDRIIAYMTKAMREAKLRTSWTSPDEEHERAVANFITRILADQRFLNDFLAFQKAISHYGILNSLAQTLLRLTAPGAPDTYQGTELWDFSLVDPDNRRPVDYQTRQRLLNSLKSEISNLNSILLTRPHTGELKLFLTTTALKARQAHRGLFSTGHYHPLHPTGPRANHLFAFARTLQTQTAITIIPRLLTQIVSPPNLPVGPDLWQDTHLPLRNLNHPMRLRNAFTNGPVSLTTVNNTPSILIAQALATFPVALLLTDP
jgi:(1->4)-alpha-D-glucan 1-alpha-D-glucosylmutase